LKEILEKMPSTDNKDDIPSRIQYLTDEMKRAANKTVPEVMDKTLAVEISREIDFPDSINKIKNYTIKVNFSLHDKVITEEEVITDAEIESSGVVGLNPTKTLQRSNIPITESSVDAHSNANNVDGVVTVDTNDPKTQQKIDNLNAEKIKLESKLEICSKENTVVTNLVSSRNEEWKLPKLGPNVKTTDVLNALNDEYKWIKEKRTSCEGEIFNGPVTPDSTCVCEESAKKSI
jgi:hypothetical protein